MVKNKPSTTLLHKTTIPKETTTTGMSSNMSNETMAQEADANVSYDMPYLHKIAAAQETAAQEALLQEIAWREADRTRTSYAIPPLSAALYKMREKQEMGSQGAALPSMSSNKSQKLPIRSLKAIVPGEHENQRVQNLETYQVEEQNALERMSSLDNPTNSKGAQSSMEVDNAPDETLYETMKKSNGPSSIKTASGIETSHETLFREYCEYLERNSLAAKAIIAKRAKIAKEETRLKGAGDYAEPFINFMTENPTVWHAIQYWENKLEKAGFSKLSPREPWNDILEPNGKYYLNRNGTSLIAFSVGGAYKSGNGIAMVAAHSDSLTARLKPISTKNNKAGYVQLGVAPYAGALNETWWDRDLGIGGRVLVRDESGSISQKLVKLDWPIARIPTLAPHFGVGMFGQNNKETQLVPIIGLDNSDLSSSSPETFQTSAISGAKSSFISTQPPKLVNLIAKELGIENKAAIINWELELFDTQPAQLGGLEKDLIFSGRIDDKVCSWSSIEALISSSSSEKSKSSGIISMVGLFDDEEIGSLLRQGANSNFLPGTVERIVESFNYSTYSPNVLMETYAKSFLVSFDVTHATNPNFLEKYLENHAPRLNVGLTVGVDSNGHTTTDSVSTAIFQRLAEKCGQKLQTFMIRNDSRSGGTVGPMLSSKMGVRAIDVGIPQLSMHSIRATTGSKDPGLGVKMIEGVFDGWEDVDAQFAAGNGW
ncbi:2f9514fa-c3ba-4483-9593-6ee7207d7e06 [Sclerotinia trifoliorum]|uniref:2f9514fa-c3ba-4483-9593-6ee7207d7e06 n=1 Tax=Sclerotinia trifoliorum TaxID=28548 RepID=A0A8H2VZK2_9HELO|nr:2f9514fa-c3ba-4483-9593-6ee7207d7e06 [Sclerotinia trifoliorum]